VTDSVIEHGAGSLKVRTNKKVEKWQIWYNSGKRGLGLKEVAFREKVDWFPH